MIFLLKQYYHGIAAEIHLWLMNQFVHIEYLNEFHELKYDNHCNIANELNEQRILKLTRGKL